MIGGLYLAGIYGFLPTNRSFIVGPEALMLFGIFSATTYGSAIAMSVQRAHEQSELSIRQSEQKYRLMADNVTDMISVHDEHGLHLLHLHLAQSSVLRLKTYPAMVY